MRMLDAYVFSIMNPRNNKLAPSLNFFGVGLYCCDVLQSRRNSLECQNQGKNNVELKGDPTFPPLDTGSASKGLVKKYGGGGGGPEDLKMWLIKNTWPTPSLLHKND